MCVKNVRIFIHIAYYLIKRFRGIIIVYLIGRDFDVLWV